MPASYLRAARKLSAFRNCGAECPSEHSLNLSRILVQVRREMRTNLCFVDETFKNHPPHNIDIISDMQY